MELEQVTKFVRGSQTERLKLATKLAFDARRRVKEGDLSVFLLPLIVAIVKDGLVDPISDIPIVGQVLDILLSFPIAVYLFIFMWGRGKWKMRVLFFFVSLLDIVPIIDLIPFTTVCVLYARHLAKEAADVARDELAKLDATMRGLSRKEQIELQRARMEAEQETAMRAEAKVTQGGSAPEMNRGGMALGNAMMAASLSSPTRAFPGQGMSPQSKAMDGVAGVPAAPQNASIQMRGQAANDARFDAPQQPRERVVSGSDIVIARPSTQSAFRSSNTALSGSTITSSAAPAHPVPQSSQTLESNQDQAKSSMVSPPVAMQSGSLASSQFSQDVGTSRDQTNGVSNPSYSATPNAPLTDESSTNTSEKNKRMQFLSNGFSQGLNDPNIIAYHGCTLDTIQYLLEHGKMPGATRNRLATTKEGNPEISVFPISATTDYEARVGFGGDTALEGASSYAGASAEIVTFSRSLGLDPHANAETMARIVPDMENEQIISELNRVGRQVTVAEIEKARKITKSSKNGGVVIGISKEAFERYKHRSATSRGEKGEELIEVPDGLPIQYIVGIEPMGNTEYQFFENLQKESLINARKGDLGKSRGAQNEGYQFSKDYSQKWRRDTAEQMRIERKAGGSRESQQAIASGFYATQRGIANEFQKDIAAGKRDIEQLSDKHKALFLHGVPILTRYNDGTTVPGRNTSMNNPLFESEKMGHLERAGGVMAVQPTISVFTRKMGEKEPLHAEESFYPVGVILGGGRVLSAYGGDAGTITQGMRQKYSKYDKALQSTIQGGIEENMSMAIERKKDNPAVYGGTNEIVVEQPEVSGAYAYISSLKKEGNVTMTNGGGYNEYLDWEMKKTLKNMKGTLEISEKYGVPAYLITHNGQAIDLLDENLSPVDVASIMREKPVMAAQQKIKDAQMLMQYARDEGIKKEIREKIRTIEMAESQQGGDPEKNSRIANRASELLDLVDEKQTSMDNGMWNFIEKQGLIDSSKEMFIAQMREKGVKEGAINHAEKLFNNQQTVEECKRVLGERIEKRRKMKEKMLEIFRENIEE